MNRPAARRRGDDDGFSLVEVIVAMVLLAVVALAFLPLVARSASAAATGTTLATATRLVSDQMEAVRAVPTCPFDENNALVGSPLTDPRGVVLQTRTDVVGTCTSGLVEFRVTVARSTAPTVPVARASTLVSVGAP